MTAHDLAEHGRPRSADVVVLGAGTAGLAAYRAAAAITPRVLLVESGVHGTTCARVGCMPSKLLIAAAEAAHDARHAGGFGVRTEVTVDGRAVMDRVRRERDRFVGFVVDAVEDIPADHKLTGSARFTGPGALTVDGTALTARTVVVATGSSPWVPPLLAGAGLGDRLVVNDDVFAWGALPRSVAVIGAGVIGLELGQALARLGVRVRVLGRGGRVAVLTDPVVRDAAAGALAAELPIDLDVELVGARRTGAADANADTDRSESVELRWRDASGREKTERFEYVLAASGRRPNVASLSLDRSGVALDAQGMPEVDRTTLLARSTSAGGERTKDGAVFFAGDVNPEVPLLHEAADEGRIAGANAARWPDVRAGSRRSHLAIVFTDPGLAVVGEGFRDVSERPGDAVIGAVSFEDQGRSRVMRKNRGAARVYADAKTGRFLGAEMAGPRAENIGHLLAWAHQQALTIDQMLAMPFYHPVVEEGIRTALRDASAKLAGSR